MWGAFFYPHRVWVRDVQGSAGMGQTWAAAPGRELSAEVKDEQRLVRDQSGREVVSSTQVTVPLSSNVAPGALVTVWRGTSAEREATVIAVARKDNTDTLLDSYLRLSLE